MILLYDTKVLNITQAVGHVIKSFIFTKEDDTPREERRATAQPETRTPEPLLPTPKMRFP
jgi:hypothetical protein